MMITKEQAKVGMVLRYGGGLFQISNIKDGVVYTKSIYAYPDPPKIDIVNQEYPFSFGYGNCNNEAELIFESL